MDDRTDLLALPLPHPEHLLVEDVVRLREALVMLDAALSRRAHDSVQIAAGAGLAGGGTLEQSRTLTVAFASQQESEAASASDVVMSPLRTAQAIEARLASEETAQAGEAATLLMTPLRTRQVLDDQFLTRLASQAQAQAGEDGQHLMSPLRSHQAFDARLATRLATQQQAEAGLDEAQLMTPLRVAQYLAVQPRGEIHRVARTSNVKLTGAEFGRFIDITSGSFTQSFDPVAALGQGWFCYLRNSGTGEVTLDPNASETLDGLTSFIMYPGELRLILCDGTVLRSVVLNAFYKVFSASGNFKKPPSYAGVVVEVIGGGHGGTGGGALHMGGGARALASATKAADTARVVWRCSLQSTSSKSSVPWWWGPVAVVGQAAPSSTVRSARVVRGASVASSPLTSSVAPPRAYPKSRAYAGAGARGARRATCPTPSATSARPTARPVA